MEVPMTVIDTVWEPHTYPTPYLKPSTIAGQPLPKSHPDTQFHNLIHSVHTHLPWHQHAHGTHEVCPDTDIRETAGEYIIEMALAGVSDGDSVTVQWRAPRTLVVRGGLTERQKGTRNGQLSGKGEEELRKVESGTERNGQTGDVYIESHGHIGTNGHAQGDGAGPLFILKERKFGLFQRTFTLPVDVKVEGCRAKLEHGLLRIDVPKVKPQERLEERLTLDDT